MSRTKIPCAVMLLAAMHAGVGCVRIDAPDGYVQVKDQHTHDFKAVSARGNIIALTSRDNEGDSATLKFWTEAVEYQKVDIDGMKLAKRDEITAANGLDGTLFQFESGEGQGKIAYWVALYVTPSKIHTVEATGPADAIAKDKDLLRTAMLSLH